MKPVWSFEAILPVSISEIENVLFAINDGKYLDSELPFYLSGRGNCTISKTKDGFVALFEDGHKQFIIPGSHSLILQGEWWYRGRYTWEANGSETKIKLEVYNVAQSKRWAASLMILPEKNKHRKSFEAFVLTLGKLDSNR